MNLKKNEIVFEMKTYQFYLLEFKILKILKMASKLVILLLFCIFYFNVKAEQNINEDTYELDKNSKVCMNCTDYKSSADMIKREVIRKKIKGAKKKGKKTRKGK